MASASRPHNQKFKTLDNKYMSLAAPHQLGCGAIGVSC
jgi:hypothetical protein